MCCKKGVIHVACEGEREREREREERDRGRRNHFSKKIRDTQRENYPTEREISDSVSGALGWC